MSLKNRHLLGLEGYPAEDIQTIIDTAFTFREVLDRPIKKVPSLQGQTIVNLFFENSTRTRISFELAQKRLSADTVNFSASTSSLKKGESFKDTVQNIEAMKIDACVMRHPTPGAPLRLTEYVDAVVINAGDGTHEHPTQAILDMTSLQEKFGHIKGLKVGIIGDISHSRVALSNIHGLITMGAKVTLCGPATLIPPHITDLGVKVNHNIDEVIAWADALNVLRIQMERMGVSLFPSVREYRSLFGITTERLAKHKKEVVIMHPGPMNRGVEIESAVADGDQAIILDQVLNGVASRMAILFLLLGGKAES
ncbi:MAG TPA: aspartate carbamoyltransferase catalytic subunit [Candidatus Marinimicrobia bacterium]|jgi:aspartate carbamoyltransferase catalytic subunit|nr:aspartate carbamoyltransferase catalytic subunit [Candidatus Neomarinimicrobiota bacterium]MDP7217126.1 aspartate carbamoyltransferase catalytic subunit [Candidatus Neomarinimicrobiota bacterium]MDP7437794.1 aspartate carbamoyltransferase catalytic subunit [Candidatus Neomarinimicrobiota bacterium]HJL74789.1 aspartate carbamoyltransferase catalytic subunit [Candidatus Neomarinimicrobiota bacterium]HJM70160.1 aspartate carbamoyltransferase catalytic subunit [Candidatus Neomarinimicrobiota bac|tara:strand:+ start:14685 stop:15614 length:930 start_codon:yes stop_codon:yes gene_type:complete